ncbi:MAG TPA: VOC family protein [Vicinamibacterales bacterium]|jgi:catechol 2,3-dioxygenase-like lactoylglutathione lyase family enzyme|nr:VOC family protein [Vicinamibacterales bacterium]
MRTMPTYLYRRGFIVSLPALAFAPRAMSPAAQTPKPQITTRGINHVNLTVSDLKRSVDFYQGLFGMPVHARSGTTGVQLGVGSGPLHLALSVDEAGARPGIDHFCLSVDGFNVDRIIRTLAEHGVTKSDQRGAMKVQVTMRGADTPQVYVGDPDGIVLQLQDVSYCAGTGPLGSKCPTPEPSAKRGLIALKGYSHLTVFSNDSQRSNAFYRELFGMGIRSYQGPTAPTLAVGPTVEFLMFTGGGAGRGAAGAAAPPPRPASINHFCMNLESFNADQIIKTLESYGIKPREGQTGPVGPMRHYISMRMENRGGAKEGTPELYFTDPDGILVQLQDVKYCGGSGVLGDVCPPI